MARKNKDGKYIIAAGEVGVFTVCPESWRLREVKGCSRESSASAHLGNRMHQDWAKKHESNAHFRLGIKAITYLLLLATTLTWYMIAMEIK